MAGFYSPLDKAITLAVTCHSGQVDKLGEPYILHPLRVMMTFEHEPERVAAVLHDVCRDAPQITPHCIGETFGDQYGRALDALTRREGEQYQDFIVRCGNSGLAKRIKIADLLDHLDPGRMGRLDPQVYFTLRNKYRRALVELL